MIDVFVQVRMKDTTFSSKAYGTRESKEITTILGEVTSFDEDLATIVSSVEVEEESLDQATSLVLSADESELLSRIKELPPLFCFGAEGIKLFKLVGYQQ